MVRSLMFALTLILSFSVLAHAHTPKADYDTKTSECDIVKVVEDGNYTTVDDRAKDKKLAPKAKCKKSEKIGIDLFRFESPISTEEVLKRLRQAKCEPVSWPQLYNFGVQHPEVQRKAIVVGLGSTWRHDSGFQSVPVLAGDGKVRELKLHDKFLGWESDKYSHYVFAAVCKHEHK